MKYINKVKFLISLIVDCLFILLEFKISVIKTIFSLLLLFILLLLCSSEFAFENKIIMELSEAYKKIFASKKINENIDKLNGVFKENPLVKDVIEFITKDKKRSICTPFSKE